MNTAKIITGLKNPEGVFYSFNRAGNVQSFAGYDSKKVDQMWALIKDANYFDDIGFHSERTKFCQIVSGRPLQTETQRKAALHNEVATMDPSTLAKFTAFIFHEEKYNRKFLSDRMADGTMEAVVARIVEMGEHVPGQSTYAGAAFTRPAAPHANGAVA